MCFDVVLHANMTLRGKLTSFSGSHNVSEGSVRRATTQHSMPRRRSVSAVGFHWQNAPLARRFDRPVDLFRLNIILHPLQSQSWSESSKAYLMGWRRPVQRSSQYIKYSTCTPPPQRFITKPRLLNHKLTARAMRWRPEWLAACMLPRCS